MRAYVARVLAYALSRKLPVPQTRCQIFGRGIIAQVLDCHTDTRAKEGRFDIIDFYVFFMLS